MGMSASQARLLSITARLSDNEMKQQSLTYAKQRLSDNTSQVNDRYLEALEKTKYQVLTGYNGNEACYAEVTYNQLTGFNSVATGKQYLVKDNKGKVLVNDKLADAFRAGNGDFNIFLSQLGYTQANSAELTGEAGKEKIHQAWDEYLASVGKSIDDYENAHILDFGYTTFDKDNYYKGYPTYNVAYAITGDTKTSLYKDDQGYYTERKPISSRVDENGKVECYITNGRAEIVLEDVHYSTETGKYTYNNDAWKDADGNLLEFDILYVGMDKTNNKPIISTELYNRFTADDEGNGRYKDECNNKYDVKETSKALNFDGTSTAQRELYDYAVALTEAYYSKFNGTTTSNLLYDAQMVSYYKNIFNQMRTCGFTTVQESFEVTKKQADINLKDANWFVNQLKAGKLVLSYYSTAEKTFKSTTLDSDESITEKEDKSAIAIAEQVYKKQMDKIEHQDKQFDLELNRLESEHNALQTEFDSVKKVISKNIDSSFKTFNA